MCVCILVVFCVYMRVYIYDISYRFQCMHFGGDMCIYTCIYWWCFLSFPTKYLEIRTCVNAFDTGWRWPIGCLKLQVIFRKRATNCKALSRKMTCTDKASYGSWAPCSAYLCIQYTYISTHLNMQTWNMKMCFNVILVCLGGWVVVVEYVLLTVYICTNFHFPRALARTHAHTHKRTALKGNLQRQVLLCAPSHYV